MLALRHSFLILFILWSYVQAQQPFFNIYEDSTSHWGQSIKSHPNGKYYINGNTQSGDNSSIDWTLLETDSLGNISWSKSWATDFRNITKPLLIGSDGNIYYPGWAETLAGNIRDDWAIFKFGTNGQMSWEKFFGSGGTNDDELEGVIETQDKHLLWFGSRSATASTEEGDGCIIKTDFAGNVKWAQEYVDPGKQTIYDVDTLPGGGFICLGYSAILSAGNPARLWLLRLDASGNIIWNRTFGPRIRPGPAGLLINADGSMILSSTITPGLSGEDALIMKLDPNGNVLWVRCIGGAGNDRAKVETRTADGGYLLSGFTYSYGFFAKDGWVMKFDALGNLIWANAYGTMGEDQIWDIEPTPDGGFLATGYINKSGGMGIRQMILFKANALGETDPCYMMPIFPQVDSVTFQIDSLGTNGPISIPIINASVQQPYAPTLLDFQFNATGNSPLCEGDTLILNVQTSHPATSYWTGPNNFNSTLQNPIKPNIQSGDFGQYIVAIDFDGCVFWDTVEVSIGAASAALGADRALCTGDSLNLVLSATGASYLWQDGSTAATFTVTIPGTYWVEITKGSCTSFDTLVVTGLTDPIPFSLGADTVFCEGDTVVLSARQLGIFTYFWQDGTGTPDHEVTEEGEYEVSVSNQCGSESDRILLERTDLPVLLLPKDTLLCELESWRIHATSKDGTLVWSTGSLASSLLVNEPGIYKASVENECGITRDSVEVSYKDCDCNFYMPNAFTPNGDDKNDTFFAGYQCLISDYRLMVFNRWGEKIFETDDPDARWFGNCQSKDCPEGVYVWIVSFTGEYFRSSFPYHRSGTVTLIR